MQHSTSTPRFLTRVLLPILISLLLVCGTVLVCGSTLYQIEDVYVNRILAGTYGEPDWRVLEMNPLLSQALAFLYRVIPAGNWYGLALLALLAASCALLMHRAARQNWGLVPVAMAISPVLILLTNAVHSQSVCALCTVVGLMTFADALKERCTLHAVLGLLLLLFGAMLSLPLSVILVLCTLICLLPGCLREKRVRALVLSLVIALVVLAALGGYSALCYSSPELSEYRAAATQYDRLQHSSLRTEADHMMDEYATMSTFFLATSEDPVAAMEEWSAEKNVWFNENLGWSINDISIFTERKGFDLDLVDAEKFSGVMDKVSFVNTDPASLFSSLRETLVKPQFILLIAMFLLCAISVILSNHRKVLFTILASLVAFGGHILMLVLYRDSFGAISPFYLTGIALLLYSFSGEDAKAWCARRLPRTAVRRTLAVICCVVFVGGLFGVAYYLSATPANNVYTVSSINDMYDYIAEHPDTLFVGDNPCERIKPDTLQRPQLNADANILAGSYDLYSPRAIEQMSRFGVTNPLADALNNSNIGYISMSFYSTMRTRLAEAYDAAYIIFDNLWSQETTSSMIVGIHAFQDEEAYTSYIAENNLLVESMDESFVHDDHGHDHDHAHEGEVEEDPDTCTDPTHDHE